MTQYLQKKSYVFIIFILASIICEVITFRVLGFGLLPTYYLISFSLTLIVGSAIFLIPGHVISVILYSVVLLVNCVLSITNIILYRIHGDIFTIDLLALTREAQAAMDGGFVVDFSPIVPFAILFAAALALQIYLITRIKERSARKFYRRHGAVVLAGVALFIGAASLIMNLVQVGGLSKDGERNIFGISLRDNYDTFAFKVPFFKAFGTYGLIYRNVVMNTPPSVRNITLRGLDETRDYLDDFDSEERFVYFDGVDAGNNVLVIMLESFDDYLIHPNYTPALYALRQQSIVFDNFYGWHKTDISEASVIFGSYPMNTTIVPNWDDIGGRFDEDSINPDLTRNFPFSLPNILREEGYGESNFFHNCPGLNYSRKFTHPTYGFDGAYFLEDFDTDQGWFAPEKGFYEEAVDLILPENGEKPFFSFITTFNAHGPYIVDGNLPSVYHENFDYITEYEDEDFADIKELLTAGQFTTFKVALSKAMVADEGIGYLIDELYVRGMAESTTIMLFADHGAYGHELTFNVKQAKRDTSPAHKIPAFIYSPQIAAQCKSEGFALPLVHNKFVMHFDLVPTLLDLLGIEYNPRMYLGFHAFDQRENIVISKLGLIFNDKVMSDGMNVLWTCPSATAEDRAKFRDRYNDMIYRWSYINTMYSPLFWFRSDAGGTIDPTLPI